METNRLYAIIYKDEDGNIKTVNKENGSIDLYLRWQTCYDITQSLIKETGLVHEIVPIELPRNLFD